MAQYELFYYEVLCVVMSMLMRFGNELGLLIPCVPEQLVYSNGITMDDRGRLVFRVVARRRDYSCLSIVFGRSIQSALDSICYGNYFQRLILTGITELPGGFVGFTLVWGCW